MPYLKLQDSQYPLTAGETTLGAFEGAGIRLPGGDPTSRAIVSLGASGVSIRLGSPESDVKVNGLNVTVEGSAQAKLTSPSTTVNGDGMVTISGGVVKIN